MRCSKIQGGLASIKELRDAFQRFQEKNKWVCFHSTNLSENGLYLSSVGTSFVSPSGSVEFNGMKAELMFFKNMLNKLGVESKIYRVGKYKSAIEPFINEKMSDNNKAQMTSLLEGLYSSTLNEIGASKDIDPKTLRDISNEMKVRSVADAVKYGILNGEKYEDEVFSYMNTLLEAKENQKLKFKDWKNYYQTLSYPSSENKIAILIAQGEIVSGKDNGEGKQIGSSSLIKQIRKVRDNEEIKAVVLRINSPGGSALASDIIWRELELLKKKKPVIASMSDLAASGGYYIAMGCNKVVASPNTITGSIGVFGLMFNLEDFLSNKLGLTFDRVQTGQFSGIPTFTRDMSAAEDSIIQGEVERIYQDFISKAAIGRNTDINEIHEVAQGRVWFSGDAKRNNLIDELGNLQDAISLSAELSKIENYEIEVYPKETGFWSKLGFSAEEEVKSQIGEELGSTYNRVKSLQYLNGYQVHAPYWIKIE